MGEEAAPSLGFMVIDTMGTEDGNGTNGDPPAL